MRNRRPKSSQLNKEKLDGIVCSMILKDLLPTKFIENEGFKTLLVQTSPGYNLPKESQIEIQIKSLYDEGKTVLQRKLAKINHFAVTAELWPTTTKYFVTVSALTIDNDWEDETFVLETVELRSPQTSSNIRNILERVLNKWHINQRTMAVVHNVSPPLRISFENSNAAEESVFCYLQMLKNVIDAGLNIAYISRLVVLVSTVAAYFQNSGMAEQLLTNKQKLLNLPTKTLKTASSEKWEDKYKMLRRVSDQKEAIVSVFKDKSCTDSIKSQFPEEDWTNLENLKFLLEPFKVIIKLMSSRNGITLSMVRPLTQNIIANFYSVKRSDNDFIRSFKSTVENELTKVLELSNPKPDGEIPCPLIAVILGTIIQHYT